MRKKANKERLPLLFAALLGARAESGALVVMDGVYTLRLSARAEEGMAWADISVSADGDEIYTLSAAKAR